MLQSELAGHWADPTRQALNTAFSSYWHTNPVAPLSLEGFGFNSIITALKGFQVLVQLRELEGRNAFGSTVENKRGHKPGQAQWKPDDCEVTLQWLQLTYLIHHQFTVQLIGLFASVGFDAPNKVWTGGKHLLHKDSQGMLYGTKHF